MKKRVFILYWLIFLEIFFVYGKNIYAFSQSAIPKKVFIIHSYSPQNITAAPQHEGILKALKKCGVPVVIKTFYMHTKTRYITPDAIKRRGEMAIKEIKKSHPDVIIVVDDNACKEVMLKLVNTRYKFVFTGMNTPPEEYNKKVRFMESRERPGHNITGVYETFYVVSLINLMKGVFPSLKKVFVLFSSSPSGRGAKKAVLFELKRKKTFIPAQLISVSDIMEYEKILKEINRKYSTTKAMVIPLVERLRAPSGMITFKEIIPFTLKHNRLLEVTSSIPFLMAKMGVLVAGGPDYKVMGFQAGEKACEILKGEPPSDIPVEDAKKIDIFINLKRAKELNIKLPFELFFSSNGVLGGEVLEEK